LCLAAGLGLVPAVFAKTLTAGRTWLVAEPDALAEIEERARAVDWSAVLKKPDPKGYRPKNLAILPRAGADRTFLVDLTYTLDRDIPDGKGGVLYPRGFRFNPLDYVPYSQTLVVVAGDDPDQLEWLETSGYAGRPDAKVLLTGGSYTDLAQRLRRPVFYADHRLVRRFNLQAVPAVVRRQGSLMEVREIALPRPDPAAR
jgi:conjugal transfer pilus assembly protein TraW